MATKARLKKEVGTTAVHAVSGGNHIVGIGNLRVVIIKDESRWFARGLEIDYAAQGDTLEEVKKSFEDGLCFTIHEYLKEYGSISNFLVPAPAQVWKELLYDQLADSNVNRYTQWSWHQDVSRKAVPEIPFQGIRYLQREKEAA